MINQVFKPTYRTSLTIPHEDKFFRAGLCFSGLQLEELKDMQNGFLHPKERAYFETLQYPKRQHSYLLGRYCAKQALAMYDDQKYSSEILIENGVFQQPIVSYLTGKNPQVSISHTDTLGAALAFSEAYPMAIDIESIGDDKDEAIQTQLTIHEKKLAASLSNNASLHLLWTIKESLSKALKCGLTIPFKLLEIGSINPQGVFFVSHFKNFHQYQAMSFLLPETACSIVYPKKGQLVIDILSIQEKILSFKPQ